MRLDFGTSTRYRNQDTFDLVTTYLPKTLQLVAAGMTVALVVSLPFGVVAAPRAAARQDRRRFVGLATPQPSSAR